MKDFLVRRWFLLGLGTVMVLGYFGSDALLPVANCVPLRYAIVATVLFVMALPLEARAMWRTLRRPRAPVLGVVMNSVALPLLAWLLVATIGMSWLGRDLAMGLVVATAVPCTLASAAVWTRRAGGNDAASIMVTVITNASCFLVTPFWLLQTTGKQTELDAGSMVAKLAVVVVLPMTLAQLLRLARPIGERATQYKTPLGIFAQSGILFMILIGSVQTAQRFRMGDTQPSLFQLSALLVATLGLHLFVLYVGMWIARRLGLQRSDQIAVGFAGSQKTLMVGLQICMELGFSILPMVVYHVGQLLIDTLIADRLRAESRDPDPDQGG